VKLEQVLAKMLRVAKGRIPQEPDRVKAYVFHIALLLDVAAHQAPCTVSNTGQGDAIFASTINADNAIPIPMPREP
jgi:hypothetical protein